MNLLNENLKSSSLFPLKPVLTPVVRAPLSLVPCRRNWGKTIPPSRGHWVRSSGVSPLWDGSSCVSLGRWLALSEPWFPHLQNEDRFGVLAVPPRSVSLLTQEPGRGGRRERGQMKLTEVRLGRGARRREGTAAQPSWPGVGQGLLTASLDAFPDAPVLGSNPDPTMDSGVWLPSPHWLHSGHMGISFLLIFQTCPPPSYLSALLVPSIWNIPPTLA